MSFKPCPECGRIAAADASACQHCGFRFQTTEKSTTAAQAEAPAQPASTAWQVISTILLILFAGAIILAAVLISPSRKEHSTPGKNPVAEMSEFPPVFPEPIRVAEIPQEKREEPETPEPPQEIETPPQPPEQPETPQEAEKPPQPKKSPQDIKIDSLFARAQKALDGEQWQTAIDVCRELAAELGDEGPVSREVEGILRLAKTELLLSRASGPEKVSLRGLAWLTRHQDKDGRWDQDAFSKNCPYPDAACDSEGTSQYDVAVTGLALLAFLENGHTHQSGGPFKKIVKSGIDWLVSQQQKDGSLGERTAESWIYNTAIGTYALCRAYAITRDYKLKESCQKAVDFIQNAQNPGLGWKYEPQKGRNDTSVTGWMVSALHAAKTAKLDVDPAAFDGAINWFDRATNTAGKTGYMRPGDDGSVIRGVNEHFAKLPTMTAAAVVSRLLCGMSKRDPKIVRGVDILMNNLPNWNKPKNDKVDMYYWYYATRAMNIIGGRKATTWWSATKKVIIDTQRLGGCAGGSWDPVGKWGMVGGRVYSTAMCILTLRILESSQPPAQKPRKSRKVNLDKYIDSKVQVSLKNGDWFEGKLAYSDNRLIILKLHDNSLREIERKDIKSMRLIR